MTNFHVKIATILIALGTLMGLMSSEVADLMDWNDVFAPKFIGTMLLHVGSVIVAYASGAYSQRKQDEMAFTRQKSLKDKQALRPAKRFEGSPYDTDE